jgi:hypothetical protein
MPDYTKLRDMVSHRITFEFDTGARIVGYVAACKPSTGMVQLVIMNAVDVLDANGGLIEHHDRLSLVPNVLTAYRTTEGPSAQG